MNLGTYTVDIIETCRLGLDGGAMFGVVPKNLWSKAYPHVDEQNRIAMAARALLIRGGGHTIVVDAGCGHKMGEKLESIYALDHSTYTLVSELEHHGVKPEAVDTFIYTHLHFDHAGGSTILDADENAVPVFPNARHYVQKDHLAWARNPTDKDRASFMPENWEPVIERGMMEVIDGPGEILPGIEVRLLFGHTLAMHLLIVHGDAADAPSGVVYLADLAPTHAHISYPWIMGYDNHPLTTLDEKKEFLPEAHERGWLMAFEHDPFVGFASLVPGARGFSVAPER